MAPKKHKESPIVKSTPGRSPRVTRRAVRSGKEVDDDDDSEVYQSMLAEAGQNDSGDSLERPLKRQRVRNAIRGSSSKSQTGTTRTVIQSQEPAAVQEPLISTYKQTTSLQTVDNSSDSDESDFAFEDVDLDLPTNQHDDEIEDLSITLEPENSSRRPLIAKRKPMSLAEKSHRVLVHKLHILCLLQHCIFVNGRCNNTAVHRHLRSLLTPKVISLLNPNTQRSQFQRNSAFVDGLNQACAAFTAEFQITSSGLAKSKWDGHEDDIAIQDFGDLIDRAEFMSAATSLKGSQDLGNQIFCALLRAVGVEARLVCSLQTLPILHQSKTSSSQKPSKPTVMAIASDRISSSGLANSYDMAVQSSASIGQVPSARRRLGQPSFGSAPTPAPKKKAKPIRTLSYPVFWVEAFNVAHQKWITVDPLVTHTVGKPSKLEPPLTYGLNQTTYVIAFEANGIARDVTKRYAKAYNAKTRRHRVEATGDDGVRWWKAVMKLFRRPRGTLDRDQVEDAEFAAKEAREGMPDNIQDFKDHPYYALERHLKRHEVIHPLRSVGKVNAGTAANPRMEAVYRRQDVVICRSADKWYRSGRIVQQGEQPLKQVPARSRRSRVSEDHDLDDEPSSTTGLYAPYQTEQYVPPPVQRGRIPKNAFGNIDLYVPSMVPAGGTHVRHSLAQRAARFLKIDYADAVTGFQFKGRHGTAIMDGVVVAERYADAVRSIIEGFEDEATEAEARVRSLEALRLWKRFLVGLRISERVRTYGDGSTAEAPLASEVDGQVEEMETVQDAGGFFPGEADDNPLQTAGQYTMGELHLRSRSPKRKTRHTTSDDEVESVIEPNEEDAIADEATGASHSESGDGGGFIVDDEQDHTETAGGLVESVDDTADDDLGGGFLPDDESTDHGFFDESHGIDATHNTSPHNGLAELEVIAGDLEEPAADEELPRPTEDDFVASGKTSSSPQQRSSPSLQPADAAYANEEASKDESKGLAVETEDSDHDSMLSHDPEDEDLEPDWLESD